MKSLLAQFLAFCKSLPKYASKPWFAYIAGLAAFSDYFIFVVPLDAIVVGSIAIARKKWVSISFLASLGSTLGAVIFALIIERFGIAALQSVAPDLLNSPYSKTFTLWLQNYGGWALLVSAITPIHQQPSVAIAALARVPLPIIFSTMLLGRFIKYSIYTWLLGFAKTSIDRFIR